MQNQHTDKIGIDAKTTKIVQKVSKHNQNHGIYPTIDTEGRANKPWQTVHMPQAKEKQPVSSSPTRQSMLDHNKAMNSTRHEKGPAANRHMSTQRTTKTRTTTFAGLSGPIGDQGPVVQSIVSLTSMLVVKMLNVLVSNTCISNSQVFLLKKYKSYSHFFSKNISGHAILNDQSFNDMLTKAIVSFEQLD